MTLRVMLVALVAALGLDLPSVEEIGNRVRSSREWVVARMPDFSSLSFEATATPAGSLEENRPAIASVGATSARVDLAFEVAVEAMASTFPADLASMESKPPIIPVESDPAPVVAELPLERDSRLDKISEAVRLTRRAVDAWASLIQPTDEPVAVDGRGDSF